jgi:hypothetical protein
MKLAPFEKELTTDIIPQVIINAIGDKNRLLSSKTDEYGEKIEATAQAERDYNVAYAKKMVTLKMDGQPVTLIPKLTSGDLTVANFYYKFRIAEGVQRACLQSIQDIRSQIDSLRSLLSWKKVELSGQ